MESKDICKKYLAHENSGIIMIIAITIIPIILHSPYLS